MPICEDFFGAAGILAARKSDVARLKAEDTTGKIRVVFSVLKSAVSGLSVLANRLRKFCRDFLKPANCSRALAAIDEKYRASLFQLDCRRTGISGISQDPIASSDIGGTLIKEGQKAFANFK